VSRILIVNDDAFAGLGVQALLVGEFHDAVLVQNTAAGILELASSRFDLVILDILQARMDGLALIARLRGLAPVLPIICMTGVKLSELMRPNLDFSELATEAGATCCLRRPIEPRQLLEAVNSSLGLSNNNNVASLHRELSAAISLDPKIAILKRSYVPSELRNAFAVLSQYVQEPGHERSGDPYNFRLVREMAARALQAIERLFQINEPHCEKEIAACDSAEVIALNNRAIELNPALQRLHGTGSPSRGRLTPREREVLALVTDGVSNKAGGFRLSISVRTFEAHRANVMGKLGAKNAAELVRFGLEGGK
jgi:DNA-binding NarL/FixJ family response regulator